MPKGFYFLNPNAMLWTSLAFTAEQKSDAHRHSNNFQNIGRLKPGGDGAAGAAAGRCLERRQPRALSPVQELLINAGSTPRSIRCRTRWCATSSDALSDVGRRAVRAAHRLRQRREPRAGAIARAAEGAGDAPRARRGPLARRPPARHRERPAHARLRAHRPAVGYAALALLGTLNIQELPRGEEIRLDGVVVAYTLASPRSSASSSG
jgi:hypothetical protein